MRKNDFVTRILDWLRKLFRSGDRTVYVAPSKEEETGRNDG